MSKLIGVFYSEFDNAVGPKILHQAPSSLLSPQRFDALSGFMFTDRKLCERVIKVSAFGLRVVGFPVCLEHRKFSRNALLFTVGFVLENKNSYDSEEDLSEMNGLDYESDSLDATATFAPLLRKLALFLKMLESETEFLSLPANAEKKNTDLSRLVDAVLHGLNTYGQCVIPVGDTFLSLNVSEEIHNPRPIYSWEVPVPVRRLDLFAALPLSSRKVLQEQEKSRNFGVVESRKDERHCQGLFSTFIEKNDQEQSNEETEEATATATATETETDIGTTLETDAEMSTSSFRASGTGTGADSCLSPRHRDIPNQKLSGLPSVTAQGPNLTLQHVLPHIDGIRIVQQIAESANVEVSLVKRLLAQLLYRDAVAMCDAFQYTNIYAVTPRISLLCPSTGNTHLQTLCCAFVTRSGGFPPPNPSQIFALYSMLSGGVRIGQLCRKALFGYGNRSIGSPSRRNRSFVGTASWRNSGGISGYNMGRRTRIIHQGNGSQSPNGLNIDERKFVLFGVLHGILQRLHEIPVSPETGRVAAIATLAEATEASLSQTRQAAEIVAAKVVASASVENGESEEQVNELMDGNSSVLNDKIATGNIKEAAANISEAMSLSIGMPAKKKLEGVTESTFLDAGESNLSIQLAERERTARNAKYIKLAEENLGAPLDFLNRRLNPDQREKLDQARRGYRAFRLGMAKGARDHDLKKVMEHESERVVESRTDLRIAAVVASCDGSRCMDEICAAHMMSRSSVKQIFRRHAVHVLVAPMVSSCNRYDNVPAKSKHKNISSDTGMGWGTDTVTMKHVTQSKFSKEFAYAIASNGSYRSDDDPEEGDDRLFANFRDHAMCTADPTSSLYSASTHFRQGFGDSEDEDIKCTADGEELVVFADTEEIGQKNRDASPVRSKNEVSSQRLQSIAEDYSSLAMEKLKSAGSVDVMRGKRVSDNEPSSDDDSTSTTTMGSYSEESSSSSPSSDEVL